MTYRIVLNCIFNLFLESLSNHERNQLVQRVLNPFSLKGEGRDEGEYDRSNLVLLTPTLSSRRGGSLISQSTLPVP